MEKCPKLKIICKHGSGLYNIDLPTARRLHIDVTNAPGTNSNAVADLTLGLMLSVCRGISNASYRLSKNDCSIFIGRDLCAKKLGLIGFGAIAKQVAARAHGFSMAISAYDPFINEAPPAFDYVKMSCFDDIVADSDFISIHVPLTKSTRNLFDAPVLSRMKQGAYLFNTSRGGIVNENALYEALVTGHLGGAGLDVIENEGNYASSPLCKLGNVTVTPHMGMYSLEAVNAVSTICANNVIAKFSNQALKNKVEL